MTKKNTMDKKINSIAKSARNNHAATIAVIAGAGLSVIGNIVIGSMTITKAIKNKKAAKANDPEPAPVPAPTAGDNNNPPAGGNQQNQNPDPDPANK